jgi:hypothetical protein
MELHNFYSPPNRSIIRMIKSRKMKCMGHGRESEYIQSFWFGKQEGKRPLESPNFGWRIILKWILEK